MDSVKTPAKSKLARTFAKVLHIRAVTGVTPVDGVPHHHHKDDKPQKPKQEKSKDDYNHRRHGHDQIPTSVNISSKDEDDRNGKQIKQDRLVLEALLAKIFATISSIKAAYSQLQYAQSPYDAEGIQVADEAVVLELKNLSELKQSYLKKEYLNILPEKTIVLAEMQELKSLLKTYEIMGKKLDSQLRLKDSEIIFLREKLDDYNNQNKLLEKSLNQSGPLFMHDSYNNRNFHLSGLNASHFAAVLRHTVKSIRSFVRLMVDEMKSASWNLSAAAEAIHPEVFYYKDDHKCFAFESFVCREMFDCFNHPKFEYSPEEKKKKKKPNQEELFFDRFTELKSVKAKDYLSQKPKSTFAKFCRVKYLQSIHPKMEMSIFGDLTQRNSVNSGEFPATPFFNSFAEMARRVWLLHCLAFSFQPEVSIFQVRKCCRFSEVYMESVADEAFLSSGEQRPEPRVAFTVVPGFVVGKTIVLQCQVYLSPSKEVARQ